MNPRMLFSMAVATMSLVFAVGCSSDAKKKSDKEPKKTAAVTRDVSNAHYTSLSFDFGETRLSPMDKKNLQSLASKARQSGREIDDIKIITWADKEYKAPNTANNSEVILARQRAESIKNYLQEDLMTEADVDYYNMAQRPGPLGKFFKTKEEKVKETFKANNDVNMMDQSLASKGLVIIEYEDKMSTNI